MDAPEVQSLGEKPRTVVRRKQVLDAAEVCFRRHGFHACSMLQIASEAGMSVGHIYRYFTGKDAIISAIVLQDVDAILGKMSEFPLDASDPKAVIIQRAEEAAMEEMASEQAPLLIEIRAEAARNPAIAELVRDVDARMSAQLRPIIAAAVGRPLEPADLEARVEMFHLIFQGIGLRIVVNPGIHRAALAERVRLTVQAILS